MEKKVTNVDEEDNKKLLIILGIIIVLLFVVIVVGVNILEKEEKNKKNDKNIEDVIEKEEDKEDIEEKEEIKENKVGQLTYMSNNKEDKEEEKLIYRISFNTNGGNYIESLLFYEDEKTTEGVEPKKDGWVFIGWYDESLTNKYEFGKYLKEDITLYAKWAKEVVFTDGINIYSLFVSENENIDIDKVNNEFNINYDKDLQKVSWQYLNNDVYNKITNDTILNENNFNFDEDIVIDLILLDKFKVTFKFDDDPSNDVVIDAVDTELMDMEEVNEKLLEKQVGNYAWTYSDGVDDWTLNDNSIANKNVNEYKLTVYTYKIVYKKAKEKVEQDEVEEIIDQQELQQEIVEEEYDVIDEIDYGQNTKIEVLKPEIIDDKEFDGWYTKEDQKIEDGYLIEKDLEVIGKWKEKVPEIIEEETINEEKIEEQEEIQEEIVEEIQEEVIEEIVEG